jgi:hypothetical protein
MGTEALDRLSINLLWPGPSLWGTKSLAIIRQIMQLHGGRVWLRAVWEKIYVSMFYYL